jgi:hypothetical protein
VCPFTHAQKRRTHGPQMMQVAVYWHPLAGCATPPHEESDTDKWLRDGVFLLLYRLSYCSQGKQAGFEPATQRLVDNRLASARAANIE